MKNHNRLFVYGIFLGENNRNSYGMTNPRYDTVLDYATFGHKIVAAYHLPGQNLSLTGLTVDIDPKYWYSLDLLESGYSRELVETTSGEILYMYVGK